MEHGEERVELLLAKRSGVDVRAGQRSGGGDDRDCVAQRREAEAGRDGGEPVSDDRRDRKSTRLNSSHLVISYAVFCLKKSEPPSPVKVVDQLPTGGKPARFNAWLPFKVTTGFGPMLCAYVFAALALIFFNDAASTDISALSLSDALPI